MTWIRFLVALQESQRCQYFDITLHRCSISLENNRKVGNWWTAASGDQDLLKVEDEDEANILKRRGVLDEI